MAIRLTFERTSIRPAAFDRQILRIGELARTLQPEGKVSRASYLKALTELHRTLLDRNEVISDLFRAAPPRRQATFSLGLSPLDLGREQRTLDHAVGLIELPGSRLGTYFDVLRELRATNRWWRTKVLELELTRQQKGPEEAAPTLEAFERLTVDSMLTMLPEDAGIRVYSGVDARDRDVAMLQGFAAPRVVLNEAREKTLLETLSRASDKRRTRDTGRGDQPQPAAPGKVEKPAAATEPQANAPPPLEPIERTPHLELGTPAPLAPNTEFVVQVWTDTNELRPGEQGEGVRIDAPGNVFALEVSLLVTGHFEIVEWPLDKLVIKRGQPNSDPLAYKVRVRTSEELRALRGDLAMLSRGCITAVFSYNGHPCGRVWRAVPLDLPAEGEDRSKVEAGEQNREHVSRPEAAVAISPDTGPTADMVVDIIEDHESDGRHYHCKVTTVLETTEQMWSVEQGKTADVVSGFMDNFTAANKEPEQLTAALRGAGLRLFRASPRNFQAAYWRLIEANRPPRTIQVNSEEPHFLWELMIPNRNDDEARYPLGVDYDIARWLTGTSTSAPSKISIRDSYVVAPTYPGKRALRHTPKESAFVCKEFSGSAIAPETFKQIRSSVKKKPVSLVHFACHGSSGTNGTEQTLELANGVSMTTTEVEGDDILKSYLRTKQPFVFLNACEVGRLKASLRSAGGFPAVMMGAKACAVIAPAWSVKDSVSFEVATSFYRELKANPGMPLASVIRTIRRRAYDDGEDSFAAYCFFGNVHAALAP